MILAVCGKGGVGKTTISAVASRILAGDERLRSLVVDADPSGGLALALGIEPRRTLNDVRRDIIGEVEAGRREPRDLSVSLDYLLAEALTERGGLAFLSIGRPEDEGCYCKVNVLLKEALEGLAGEFDTVLIDAEAGIEQVNRKVMASVDYVLLVSDTSMKAVRVAETVRVVAERMAPGARAGLLVNRTRGPGDVGSVEGRTDLEILGGVPEDDTIRAFDEEGRSFFELPDCPAAVSIAEALSAAGFPGG